MDPPDAVVAPLRKLKSVSFPIKRAASQCALVQWLTRHSTVNDNKNTYKIYNKKHTRHTKMHLTGGCLCEAVRYEIDGEPPSGQHISVPAVCHCRMCQKSAGAPMLAYAAFRKVRKSVLMKS